EGGTDSGTGSEEGGTDSGAGSEEGGTDSGTGSEEGSTDSGAGSAEGSTDAEKPKRSAGSLGFGALLMLLGLGFLRRRFSFR
ncbi:GlyGly-CTERM sorting domain-containing protein, partial [Vibrio azureus]